MERANRVVRSEWAMLPHNNWRHDSASKLAPATYDHKCTHIQLYVHMEFTGGIPAWIKALGARARYARELACMAVNAHACCIAASHGQCSRICREAHS